MSTESVRCRDEGHVRVLTLDRPEKKNAFDNALYHELAAQIRKAVGERSVRVLVVTGSGDAFSAGQDMSEMNVEAGAAGGFPALLAALEECDKPIVAAVNGTCAGAGVSLAMAADFRLASDKASFLMAFVKIGLVPDAGGTWFLPRLVGLSKAVEMCMTGDKIDAAEAQRIGLVHRVVPHAELAAEAGKLAAKLAVLPTKAIGFMKRAFLRSYGSSLEEQLEYEAGLQAAAARTEDFHEGVRAFLDKRVPTFRGK